MSGRLEPVGPEFIAAKLNGHMIALNADNAPVRDEPEPNRIVKPHRPRYPQFDYFSE
jgi:hypothetical protein